MNLAEFWFNAIVRGVRHLMIFIPVATVVAWATAMIATI